MSDEVVHIRFRTTEPEVADDEFRRSYAKSRMSPVERGAPFLFEHEMYGAGGFTIANTVFRGEMTGDNLIEDYVTVGRTISGRMNWEVRGDRGTASDLTLLQRGDVFRASWGPVTGVLLNLDRVRIARTAALLYGGRAGRIRFDSPHPVSRQLARHYIAVTDYARSVVATDGFGSPLVRASLYRSLAVAVLEGFQLAGDRATRAFSVAELAAVFRRARRFMDDYASLPITGEDVAQAVGVPGTEIRRSFAAFSLVTPTQYLRGVRLSAARDDLQRADPTKGDTVRGIAHRWGFADPGRFARHFRASYGVNPKQVLDR
jgi:AraC-like DNA-binding protein